MQEDKGLRHNEGKTRYDLLPAFAQEQYAKVMTFGSVKYAERNWERGMKWSKVIASGERHLAAIKRGEDFDPETGLLHAAHLMCNAAFLTDYYKIYPQGDDRPHAYLRQVKIGLDLDEVIIDWVGAWTKKFGYSIPECWHFSYDNKQHFEGFSKEELDEFYLSLQPRIKPEDLSFEPHCYITSRSVPEEITKKWIQAHGFPTVPVYSIGFGKSKVDVAKSSGIDLFIDDRFDNFVELNAGGICCLLMDSPHNKRYDVGFKRIKDFADFKERFL